MLKKILIGAAAVLSVAGVTMSTATVADAAGFHGGGGGGSFHGGGGSYHGGGYGGYRGGYGGYGGYRGGYGGYGYRGLRLRRRDRRRHPGRRHRRQPGQPLLRRPAVLLRRSRLLGLLRRLPWLLALGQLLWALCPRRSLLLSNPSETRRDGQRPPAVRSREPRARPRRGAFSWADVCADAAILTEHARAEALHRVCVEGGEGAALWAFARSRVF